MGYLAMTPAQDEALDRIKEIMREHFTTGICVVEGDFEDQTCKIKTVLHGGIPAAIGLLEIGKQHALNQLGEVEDEAT